MKKQNFFLKIWRVIYPILIHFGCSLIITFLGVFAIMLGLMFAKSGEDISVTLFNKALLRYTVLLTGIFNLVAIPFLMLFRHLDAKKYPLGKLIKKATPLSYLLTPVIAFAFCISLNNLLVLSGIMEHFDTFDNISNSLYTGSLMSELLWIGIVGPIGEELAFRGLVYQRLRDYVSCVPAIIISALLFGVYHGNVVQGIYAFCIGCILAFIYEKYQNLLAPILIHVFANCVSVILSETSWLNFLYQTDTIALITTFSLLIIGIIFLILCGTLVHTTRDVRPEYIKKPRKVKYVFVPYQPIYTIGPDGNPILVTQPSQPVYTIGPNGVPVPMAPPVPPNNMVTPDEAPIPMTPPANMPQQQISPDSNTIL